MELHASCATPRSVEGHARGGVACKPKALLDTAPDHGQALQAEVLLVQDSQTVSGLMCATLFLPQSLEQALKGSYREGETGNICSRGRACHPPWVIQQTFPTFALLQKPIKAGSGGRQIQT